MTLPPFPQAASTEKSSNLAFAFFLLGGKKLADIRTFYKFCRLADDVADTPDLSIEEKSSFLENWAGAFVTRNYSSLPRDLAELIVLFITGHLPNFVNIVGE
jgi:hypothetical protein